MFVFSKGKPKTFNPFNERKQTSRDKSKAELLGKVNG
jgi:hypothetical protein